MTTQHDSYTSFRRAAFDALAHSLPNRAIAAIHAGVYLSIVAFACSMTVCSTGIPLLGALIFPTALISIILTGSSLYTGQNMFVLALFEDKPGKKLTLVQLIKILAVTYAGNFIGCVVMAWILTAVRGNNADFAAYAINVARYKVSLGFGNALVLGILCNFLVCTAVWLGAVALTVSGKAIGIFIPIFLFVLSGFEHSIANMYYIAAGIFLDSSLTWADFFVGNIIPVTIGNTIGGVTYAICARRYRPHIWDRD